MEENKRKQIKKIRQVEGKYIKKVNIAETKIEEKKEEKPSVGCFQLVVVENIPWYKKVIRKVFGIFKLKITISRI